MCITVADWQQAAGGHCHQVHEAVLQQGQLDLQQVQTDEIRVKAQGQIVWMALAIAVTTRLWLGGALSTTRDMKMAVALALQVKACALCRPLLVCFDGWVAYIRAFHQVFRTPLREGQVGRPRLISWPDLAMGQVVKRYARRRVVGIERHIIQGSEALVQHLVTVSQGHGVLNTVHRTLAGHLSESPGLSGPTGPQPGAHGEDPGGGHVSDGLRLQLLYLA